MLDLKTTEKSFLIPHIKKGGVAVDFTMGNGHDTLWLSKALGEHGKVYAFDVQQAALDSTKALLESENAPENYTLILDSHHNSEKYVSERICVGMFNLGWLPGSDKTVRTHFETTLPAIEAAIRLLDDDGALLIAVYPGHAEGAEEGVMIGDILAKLDRRSYCAARFNLMNSPTSPYFYLVEKK